MRYARLLVLGVAMGAGLLAARMVMTNNNTPQQVTVIEPEVQVSQTVSVLVATKDVNLGDKLASSNLEWKDWPEDALPSGAITQEADPNALDTFTGQIAKAPIYSGEPIRSQRLINTDRGFMAAILPKGKRAIAVAVEAETTAGGFILPGDKVDLILTRQIEGSSVSAASETILENVKVLAIDTTTAGEQDQKALSPDRTATLELGLEQAEIVAQAQQIGRISLALRSAQDSQDDDGGPVSRKGGVNFVKYGVTSQSSTR